ncbi:cell division protein FtsL [Pseudomonadales bacterium]|nr:cell division protein FtsL [Pseudomonadales bacterium]MDB4151897.1 cell division protein FtsL [Pseudomonadales bacterium]
MIRETLLGKLVTWLSGWTQISAGLMLVVLIASALGVIYSVHLTRQQYSELQELQATQDYLDSEYERLLLEQSAWADYGRIDQVSRDELQMLPPEPKALIVVRR